jgi:prepilin-type N-terminal cleavage/methylation domain-containing protein
MHQRMRTTTSRENARATRACTDNGLTLVEVLVGMVVLSVAALGSAGLSSRALHMAAAARLQTTATVLAAQKMEQLRALAWRFDDSGVLLPVSDSVTDLSHDPMTAGGTGLSSSPGGTLMTNTVGYVDYLDKHGAWAGNGGSPPASAVFIRRWNVAPLPFSPADALVLRVLVTTVVRDTQASLTPPRRRLAGDAMVVTVLARKAG